MPRYCAATCCRNRAGQSARDQRKLSFYPRFPLHDKERLEKWLRNMKRDTWTPSKHQVLCSDHFTPDSLDVRWGIRYLKTTAVPTIFSSSVNQEKGFSQKRKQEKMDVKQRDMSVATASLKLASPKKNTIEESLYRKALCTTLSKSPEKKGLLKNTEQTSPVLMPADVQNSTAHNYSFPENCSFNNSIDNIFSSTTTILQTSVHDLHSCLERLSDSKVTVPQTHLEHLGSSPELNNITVPINDLPSDQLDFPIASCSVELQETDENTVLLHTVSQALEQLNGNKDSVITIIVPSEGSRTPLLLEGSFLPAEQELINIGTETSACIASYSGIDVLQTEHSYCRQDSDREQLWQKITKLHSKIALLEIQERKTLNRLKSLEALIAKLKQENLLSEEKLKIVENCFTTFEVTMIQ
uniref:THAP domain-containing protein 5 isoform X3 n=1 Tax=Podarcis muralis TaxID=64176 RepID=UPI0010A05152|nr:THAP domain-containing protein 5 isoform X3 [Podarcis muralis]